MNRSCDWMEQAKTDLEHARKSIAMGDFDWTCFAAQQAAEKAAEHSTCIRERSCGATPCSTCSKPSRPAPS